jgi:hypothetical protein
VIKKFRLPNDESAVAVGLMDILRRKQITVHQEQPADRVVKLAASHKTFAIIAVNDYGVPVGILIPDVAIERLPDTGYAQSPFGFTSPIAHHINNGDLAGAISEINKRHQNFHSERFNLDASDPYICAGDEEDGSHNINACPCRYHPSAGCGRRQIATRNP